MKAILLANGEGNRWNGVSLCDGGDRISSTSVSIYKQEIKIKGETIIGRTIRMLGEQGLPPYEILVVGPDVLWASQGVIGWKPRLQEVGPLLEGIMLTRFLWDSSQTAILMGDVVFSYNALGLLLDSTDPVRVVGRSGANPVTKKDAAELFGISMQSESYEIVMGHCDRMTKRGARVNYPPKLWALYRLLAGFEHDEYKHEDEILRDPCDYTDDIDSIQEYKEFWKALRDAATRDGVEDPDPLGLDEYRAYE